MRIAATSARRAALLLCAALSVIAFGGSAQSDDPPLHVLKTGLGNGTVTGAGINCGTTCDANVTAASVILMESPDGESSFDGWDGGGCSGTASSCTVPMSMAQTVTARFRLNTPPPMITDLTPAGLQTYLSANPTVNTPARFLAALRPEFRQNWILMSRSESLQTGTAHSPRILLPNNDLTSTFSIGMTPSSSYPGAHPLAIEYMQWDPAQKNFRFHEIVVAPAGSPIPAMPPSIPDPRPRGVSADDYKCFKCHSTHNVINRTTANGTSGPPGGAKFRSKPNWDAYDSWGGMMPFNRDRIYQGSVDAAAFRRTFNLWNWRNSAESDGVRQILEQLQLQSSAPMGTPHTVSRNMLDMTDAGHIAFGFDPLTPLPGTPATIGYDFDRPHAAPTPVTQGGRYVTLRVANPIPDPNTVSSNNDAYAHPDFDEGRGVQFFDLLGGLDGTLNGQRIAAEVIDHHYATGSFPIDVRPIALAVAKGCVSVNSAGSGSASPALSTTAATFFNSRNGLTGALGLNDLVNDTRTREQSLPKRKADIQKINFDRTNDPYVVSPINGLILEHGSLTADMLSTSTDRLRREVFRRPIEAGVGIGDSVIGGIYVDREAYGYDVEKVTLFRYFLEPLGVSVDKWSMSVRGRSRTYTFADVFSNQINRIIPDLGASLGIGPNPDCSVVMPLFDSAIASLPGPDDPPQYTDVQRIFNKACIECHGGLHYPPYVNFEPPDPAMVLDLSEQEHPPAGTSPMAHAYTFAQPRATSLMGPIYRFITRADETCPPFQMGLPTGMMPCGGPQLSKADIETIRRWIEGSSAMYSEGDPHIITVNNVPYDFQSAGEFVLLRDLDLEVQVRQTPVRTGVPLPPNDHTGLSSCVSLNSAVALRVGPTRITYQSPREASQKIPPDLRIDGKLTKLDAGEIRLPAGGRVFRSTTGSADLQVDTPGGTVITITTHPWVNGLWYMNVDLRQGRATEGLMGTISPKNWLPALPDGTQLGPRPVNLHQRYVDLYEKFEKAWRVKPSASLFDYAPGTSTATYTMEAWPPENATRCDAFPDPRFPAGPEPRKPLDPKVAREACGKIADRNRFKNCVADVTVTGDVGFADAYRRTEATVQRRFPAAPRLDFPPDRGELPAPVTFTFEPARAEGSTVTYRQCVWPIEKQFTLNDCQPSSARMTVTPAGVPLKAGRSYFWKVLADDGKGGLTESETRRIVVR